MGRDKNITFPEELEKEIERVAEEMYLKFQDVVRLAVSEYLRNRKP